MLHQGHVQPSQLNVGNERPRQLTFDDYNVVVGEQDNVVWTGEAVSIRICEREPRIKPNFNNTPEPGKLYFVP